MSSFIFYRFFVVCNKRAKAIKSIPYKGSEKRNDFIVVAEEGEKVNKPTSLRGKLVADFLKAKV